MFGPPMSADLDDDGDLEMIMGHYVSSVSYAAAYHHDGTIVNEGNLVEHVFFDQYGAEVLP